MKNSEIGFNVLSPSPRVDYTADNYSTSSKLSSSLAPSFNSFSVSFPEQSLFMISLSSSHSTDQEGFTTWLKNFPIILLKRPCTFLATNGEKIVSLLSKDQLEVSFFSFIGSSVTFLRGKINFRTLKV